MSRASLCMLGLIVCATGLSCGGAAPKERGVSSPVQAVLLPEPGLTRERPAPPPFALTSTDGVGLKIAGVSATTVIEDPVAVTELKLTFENPEARTLEGRFTFTIPQGASLSRFGMRINGSWMEGEVVEKQEARVTYEEFLHKKRDPALLEQGAGNELAVRIFPIQPHEKKELVVTYSEVLAARNPYRLRLAGLANVAKLDATIFSGGKLVAEHHASDTKPAGDLVLPAESWAVGQDVGIRSAGQAIARVRIPESAGEAAPLENAVLLVDTSASRALDLSRELAALQAVVAKMPPDAKLDVACFDQEVVPVYAGAAKGFGAEQIAKIQSRGALGASNLSAALAWARKTHGSAGAKRLVLFTDGVATAGHRDQADIARFAASLDDAGFERADAVVLGGIRDEATLTAITKGALPSAGVVVGVDEGADGITRRLSSKTLPAMPVTVDGADWVHPAVVQGAQPGDEITIAIESRKKPVSIEVGSFASKPLFREAAGPIVGRSVALAKIAQIEADRELSTEQKRAKIVPLSTQHRIVSDHTAMLVLETESDYDRFKIDRTANLDVLAIVDGRIAMQSVPRGRQIGTAWQSAADDSLSARGNMWGSEVGDAFGAGGLGLAGVGEGGGGRSDGIGLGSVGTIGHGAGTGTGQGFGNGSSGRMAGAHRTRPPQVRMGATSVSGRLPPEVVQRIVRQNFGRFRGCYESELGRSSTVSGRVTVRFVIQRDGSVGAVSDSGSTLNSPSLIRCVTRAFTNLTFPVPEGGPVTVVYPIMFGSDASEVTEAPLAVQRPRRLQLDQFEGRADPLPEASNEYEGRFAKVMAKVAGKDAEAALAEAIAWRAEEPGDVLAYLALGEAAELAHDKALASRAYGSILELWSYRVDMLRLAGERLERVGDTKSQELADESYSLAIEDRPDHPSSHRLRAMSLIKLGKPAEAFDVLASALDRSYADGRFAGVETILRDDLALAGAAWAAQVPDKKDIIAGRLAKYDRTLAGAPSLRFVLVWETDASDVDLHVGDGRGDHAYFGRKTLVSGGRLEADVTNGYGPEAFTIDKEPAAYPYKLRVRYYARGPMGFGMGKVQVIRHDGKGKITFDERPFVLMKDHAVIDLGEVRPPTKT